MISDAGRKSIQESNRYRSLKCGKCGSHGTEVVSGERIGGMPSIQYRYCPGCGWSRAITQRMTRAEMIRRLR